jgi:hypothetical protein
LAGAGEFGGEFTTDEHILRELSVLEDNLHGFSVFPVQDSHYHLLTEKDTDRCMPTTDFDRLFDCVIDADLESYALTKGSESYFRICIQIVWTRLSLSVTIKIITIQKASVETEYSILGRGRMV